jgi:DNA-binding FadR family transcriptional regulator
MIEPTAAGLAAEHASPREAELLMSAVAAMRASADRLANFNDADIAFHVALFDATHNAYLARLGRAISSALLGSFRISATDPGRALAAADKHQFVADAIAAGNSEEATRRMIALIDQAATDLAVVLKSPSTSR